ncbi:hypothetical protein M0D69_42495 [Caballeronia sp. SEWSISQ10-4 2]|uniref:hypothetical protein n=1 Tax=Caballeronia sp. SEWSISQ10-4 2 TaxID=2937438 RepID=UPI00264B6BC7|nr:hypothetical protein [Caballeronia sp. SEWSISQ10-4 2]MDN7184573.1 hypothetical protein [Caballeronia sp. SEWSISQ10-4 2]
MATGNVQYSGSIAIDPHDLEMVTAGTTPRDLAREAIYAVDATMRDHYAKSRTRLMANLNPVIVVQYSFGGGTYTLIHDGVRETVSPVGPNFEMCKSIAHIPLGIYSMLAPYLCGARPVGWQMLILNFRNVITNALNHLKAAELPPEAERSCRTIIDGSASFLDGTISDQAFSIESFEQFTSQIQDAIQTNMRFAVQAQLDGVLDLLRRWRTQLGPAKWKQLYAVVMAIWTTEVRNQNWLLLKHMMDPETVDSHLITIATAAPEENTVSVALENLARIVQDNIAASMVFSAATKFDLDHATALVGPDDLLAGTIEEMLKGCPRNPRAQR